MKKKTELQVGDIWGVLPLEKTLEMRIISDSMECTPKPDDVDYVKPFELIWKFGQGCFFRTHQCSVYAFQAWITRNKLKKPIGHYDFKTGKAKGGKR